MWKKFVFLLITCLTASAQAQTIQLVDAFPNLNFSQPLYLTHAPDDNDRLFLVQQNGYIYVFDNDEDVTSRALFLDVQNRINSNQGEQGLLGLAFHPSYDQNGYFYINYTTGDNQTRRSVISRFSVDPADPNQADPNSEMILLEISQPYTNHNGGMLAFGPDGYLYIGLGDGGSGGDPQNNAQNRTNLLGTILRIDVDESSGSLNYGIPPDNPFYDNNQGFREEIYAYGLRNPWRFSFDMPTGQLWAGDVGQNAWEEIDIIVSGGNYGWRIMEGNHCYNPPNDCDQTGLILPILEYDHTQGESITGGYVYRGALEPALQGAYIYGDFSSGRIWSLRYDGQNVTDQMLLLESQMSLSSFGVDASGELYMLDYFGGKIYRFSGSTTAIETTPDALPSRVILQQNFPNPVQNATRIAFALPNASDVHLAVFDVAGRKIDTLIESHLPAGWHHINWQPDQVAPGVYFYRLQTETHLQARRLIRLDKN